MVVYITSTAVEPAATLFMGEDKFENEDLIKWGWPEDVWFHVDKLSSAHVYLRLKKGQTIEDIPKELITEACQLVKENSIMGKKAASVDVVYTLWANLKKTAGMEVGQIGFWKEKEVKTERNVSTIKEIVKRLEKTRDVRKVDLQSEREERDGKEREVQKALARKKAELEKQQEKERAKQAEVRSYTSLMKEDKMTTNRDEGGYDSDDFM